MMLVPCLPHDLCGLAGCIHDGLIGIADRGKVRDEISSAALIPKSRAIITAAYKLRAP